MRNLYKMKKMLLVLAATLFSVSSAFAGITTLYSWESPDGTPVETGGTMAYTNGDGSRLNYANAGYYTICLNGKAANMNDEEASANAGHMLLTLDEALQTGDVISITAYRNNNADGKVVNIYFLFENGKIWKDTNAFTNISADDSNADYDSDGDTPNTVTWTITDEEAGSKTIKLTRNTTGTNLYITKMTIERTVEGIAPVEVSPAAGSTVNELSSVALTFDVDVDCNRNASIEVKDADGNTVTTGVLEGDASDYKKVAVKLASAIKTNGTYTVTIPAEAIYDYDTEKEKTSELVYTYTVDVDYWDPEWVVEVMETSQEAPCQLVAGRKYAFTSMYTYCQYVATESGRLYLTKNSDSYVSLAQFDTEWNRIGSLNQDENGAYWIGVEAGNTYNLQVYGLGTVTYSVTFDGTVAPYDAISYISSDPADGSVYSKAVRGAHSYTKGAIDFVFSHKLNTEVLKIYVVIPSLDNKKIDITDDVVIGQDVVYEVGYYCSVRLAALIDDIKEENGLKPGDKISVLLENVQDQLFAANVLAENPQVTLELAATTCLSVSPSNSYEITSVPTELSLSFDSENVGGTGGWVLDLKTGTKTDIGADAFSYKSLENWDGSMVYYTYVTLPENAVSAASKYFQIELTDMKDKDGYAVSYGSEAGRFVIDYTLSDARFQALTVSPEEYSEVTSIKEVKITFGDEVHFNPNAEKPYLTNYKGGYFEGTLSVDPTDAKTVVVTLDEEVTTPSNWYLIIKDGTIYNSGFDEAEEDLGIEKNGAAYNSYIEYSFTIPANTSATTISSISPEPYLSRWFSESISKLPAEVVVAFEGTIKSVESVTVSTGSAVTYEIKDNQLVLTIPEADIAAITNDAYVINIKALGDDDKYISYALDSWGDRDQFAEYIEFQYYVEKKLELVEVSPAANSTVNSLSTITLTFDQAIYEVDKEYSIKLYDENDNAILPTVTTDGNTATLTFSEPVTTAGFYCLSIPVMFYTEGYASWNDYQELYYTVDPTAVSELAITAATPENGSTAELLTKVEFTLNKEVGFLKKSSLIPADGGDDAATASLTQSETDPTSWTLDFTYDGLMKGAKLREGVSYTLTLSAYSSEDAYNYNSEEPEVVTLTYVGSAAAYEYSTVELTGITPNVETVISDASQNTFVVTFSGAVELVENLTFINIGQGVTQAFESMTANDDKTAYTLVAPASYMNSLQGGEINLVVAANDLEGKRVKGNSGEEDNSCFHFDYQTTIGVPDLAVTPADGAEVAELSVITISCADGISPSWCAGNITLVNAAGESIALNEVEAVIPEDKASDYTYTPTEWTLALQTAVDAIETYTLTIPANYFNIGNAQGQIMGSKETVVILNITAEAKGIKSVAWDANAEVKVYNLNGVLVATGKAADVLNGLNKGIYIVNGKKFIAK